MKTHFFPFLLLLAGCCLASAQTERYVTITTQYQPIMPYNFSNQVSIVEGETAEVVTFYSNNGSAYFTKDGISVPSSYWGAGGLVRGPAMFTILSGNSMGRWTLLTLKIKPESYPPDKTVILPPGTNQFFVTLESSTNLVQWATATNGIYGSPDEARFFRIHMQKLD